MKKDSIDRDVYFNSLPTSNHERLYGTFDFLAIQITFGIAAWFFLVGSLTGLTVRASEAIPIVIFGNCVPLFLIAPLAVIFARYGTEQWASSAAVLGHKFKDIWLFIYITSSFGWIAYAAYLFGQSAIKFMNYFGGPVWLTNEVPGAIIFAILATFVGVYIAYRGPDTLKWFTRSCAIFLIIVLGYFIYVILGHYGLVEIYSMEPAEPLETLAWSRASAIEWNVGLGLSWAFWFGQWTRLAKSEKAAYHGCLWGWGLLAGTAGIFSAFTALVLKVYDPSEWIITLGSPVIATIGLSLFALANIGSIACLVYPMSITYRNRFPSVSWKKTVLICSVGALLLENPIVFAHYGVYLAYIALLTGAYSGIMLADYFLINKGEWAWSIREIYNRNGVYQYWKGFNPAAVIATMLSAGFYLWTLEPLSWSSPNGLFPYITAGIPSLFIGFISYAILMKVWVMKRMNAPLSEKNISLAKNIQ
ncbi:cytosine permease [Desulforhopalus singaporensis]|uniref:Cytosine/uracil/thiamine/allantoin permease n=1 Tax=Desulforhopalus singaporensis TaxID=91360 RepID=A0A1H0VDI4_9BACT|nr:cytosine permease [Desulforhopalus singaporensis]SDP76285.1 Cytosine/uracil/thiamine/allantoin permease [Desulforhopalus singaporensis]